MHRIALLFFLAGGLAACGSITHPLPKCDGYSRRPLNRSMWQWEDNTTKQPTSNAASATGRAASYAEEPASTMLAAFAHIDVAASYRPCEVK
jgi:type IV secretion system protein VirB7